MWALSPVTIAPTGGTLVSHGIIEVDGPGNEIDGDLQVFAQPGSSCRRLMDVPGAGLTVTGTLTNFGAELKVQGDLTAHAFIQHGYLAVTSTGHVDAGTLSIGGRYDLLVDGGGRVSTAGTPVEMGRGFLNTSGCGATIDAPLVLSADTHTIADVGPLTVGCRGSVINGPVTLDGDLYLGDANSPHLGDRHVVLHSSDHLDGVFSSLSAVNYGPNHWDVTYTAHDVVATLAAGNV